MADFGQTVVRLHEARASVTLLRNLLIDYFLDDDECVLDVHGCCGTHRMNIGGVAGGDPDGSEPCPMPTIRLMVAAAGRDVLDPGDGAADLEGTPR